MTTKKKLLTPDEALQKLQALGSRTQGEREWAAEWIPYMINNGRVYFYDALLSEPDFLYLIIDTPQDLTKVKDLENTILETGYYDADSYLALRDPNQDEQGSFYVENGKHRALAFKNLLNRGGIKYNKVPAIIAMRSQVLKRSIK